MDARHGKKDAINVLASSPQQGEQARGRCRRPPQGIASTMSAKPANRPARLAHGGGLPRRLLILLALIFFLLCGTGLWFAVTEFQAYSATYHRDMSLAQTGEQHLHKAQALLTSLTQNPLNGPVVHQAQSEFASAMTTFVQLGHDLQSLPGIAMQMPIYGTRLSAGLKLVTLADEVAVAGEAACALLDILVTKTHVSTQGHGFTMDDITNIDHEFQLLKLAFGQVVNEANQLQPGDLQFDPPIGVLFATYAKQIPLAQTWLDALEKVLPALPMLLGIASPANYLIEMLDSTELRPGGGFIGNYGIATLSRGHLVSAHITDVELIDEPFKAAGHRIPYPPAYAWFPNYLAPEGWSLRDSNIDADFPTAARYGELNYMREGGNAPLQGVVAITPFLIEHMLNITGPINLPEYGETITAQNLIERIHFHQLGPAGEGSGFIPSPDGHSSLRKRFTELLAEHFFAQVQKLSSTALPKILQVFVSSLHSKDIQLYFNTESAEGLLQRLHLDDAIQSPARGDSLFVVDANVSPNKANSFIVDTLDDQVTIDQEGNALHHTTLTYAWTIPGHSYGFGFYRDYLRFYVPPGSVLQTQNGWQPLGIGMAFGREVWIGFYTLRYDQTRKITLTWIVPHAATRVGQSWNYQYLIQKQAGTLWTIHVQVLLPSHAVVTSTWGGMMVKQGLATLSSALSEDMQPGMAYNS